MRFWLDRGCDGFRVDMADCLVKNDDERKSFTSSVWRDVRAMLDADYPEAVLVSEWGAPKLALRAGFDMDFYLNNWGNGYSTLMRDYDQPVDNSYFRAAADRDINRFLDIYRIIEESMKRHKVIAHPDLDQILETERETREYIRSAFV
jgi:maltose alpha-D-glucosyltransferase/alpha-amylase